MVARALHAPELPFAEKQIKQWQKAKAVKAG